MWMAVLTVICSFSCSRERNASPKELIAAEIEQALRTHVITPWYPRSVDSVYGGYLCDFNYRWQPGDSDDKMIVSQARHVWTNSKLEEIYPDQGYAEYAAQGVSFLKDHMWDQQYGGFHSLVGRDGTLTNYARWGALKTAYGNAFGIYGLSAYVKVTGDTEVLEFAKDAFRWLDSHSHDPLHGGYFQFITREGQPVPEGHDGVPPKDQNSSIHLLEAFSELYQVWPNDTVRERLSELLITIRDVVAGEKGYMNLFFNADWSPVLYRDSLPEVREANYSIDHVSFGHDIETAYLLMEASEVLGLDHDQETLDRAKLMVDHVLENGWDPEMGGVYDRGYYMPDHRGVTIITDSKVWWSQVEAMNTLLIMSELYPDDPMDYYGKFEQQWNYLQTNIFDSEHGGVYVEGLDNSHESKTADKGGLWKVNYHTARSLMNCMKMLRQ